MAPPTKAFTVVSDTRLLSKKPWTATMAQEYRDNDIHLEEWLGGSYTAAIDHDHDGVNSAPLSLTATIGQAELKTSTGTGAAANGNATLLTAPGGQYGFYPQVRNDNASQTLDARIHNSVAGTSYTSKIWLDPGGSVDGRFQQRYITASPPWDLGDGPMCGFIFLLVDGTSKVLATYLADVPPWGYNGPTDIRPVRIDRKTGKVYRRREPSQALKDDFDAARIGLAEYRQQAAIARVFPVEIDQAWKNRDMPLIPHPFEGNDLAGKTVILLDPLSRACEDLMSLHAAGEDVVSLITSGRVSPDNTALSRAGPAGVMQVAIKL